MFSIDRLMLFLGSGLRFERTMFEKNITATISPSFSIAKSSNFDFVLRIYFYFNGIYFVFRLIVHMTNKRGATKLCHMQTCDRLFFNPNSRIEFYLCTFFCSNNFSVSSYNHKNGNGI